MNSLIVQPNSVPGEVFSSTTVYKTMDGEVIPKENIMEELDQKSIVFPGSKLRFQTEPTINETELNFTPTSGLLATNIVTSTGKPKVGLGSSEDDVISEIDEPR